MQRKLIFAFLTMELTTLFFIAPSNPLTFKVTNFMDELVHCQNILVSKFCSFSKDPDSVIRLVEEVDDVFILTSFDLELRF
ncbi:hypothetical protein Lalb_Chr08g0236351 [Lupinus albus]|uniref:Uncharacterized protein n=1 Tax=Lupinus albus TaxID=3870 RepID=A0A6A4Q4N8_LUPAL|nr:hypothetical protein Lalb_Chr08g0236351 [Lupinus albus]